MFTECGMEVYETSAAVYIERQQTSRDGGRNSSLLQLRASVEQLHQQLYAIHGVMDQLNLEEDTRNSQVEAWMGHVQTTLGSLTDVRPEDIARNRPWEL